MAKKLADLLNKTRKKIADNSGNYERPENLPKGVSRWRILPGWDEKEPGVFFHGFGQHFIKDPKTQKVVAVIPCMDRTHDEPCPVCDWIRQAMDEAVDDDGRKFIGEMKSSQRFLVNAVRMDKNGNHEDEVKLLALPQSVMEALVEIAENHMVDEDADTSALFDPGKDGVDVSIKKDGEGLNTKYTVTALPASKCKPIDKSVLMARKDIGAFVSQTNEKGLAKAKQVLLGAAAAAPAGALTGEYGGPGTKSIEDKSVKLDDDIPDDVEDAVVVDDTDEETAPPADFDKDIGDDELDALLADL